MDNVADQQLRSVEKFNVVMKLSLASLGGAILYIVLFRIPCRGDCLFYPFEEIFVPIFLAIVTGIVGRIIVTFVSTKKAARLLQVIGSIIAAATSFSLLYFF